MDVAILGLFKASKSSFIKSFIGRDVLSTAVIPATSVITRVFFKKIHKQPKNGRNEQQLQLFVPVQKKNLSDLI
mgnify:CR=1 FL=1